jgi:8-oxo-dGTP pyrophosphatase MutT (NUDIX family)
MAIQKLEHDDDVVVKKRDQVSDVVKKRDQGRYCLPSNRTAHEPPPTCSRGLKTYVVPYIVGAPGVRLLLSRSHFNGGDVAFFGGSHNETLLVYDNSSYVRRDEMRVANGLRELEEETGCGHLLLPGDFPDHVADGHGSESDLYDAIQKDLDAGRIATAAAHLTRGRGHQWVVSGDAQKRVRYEGSIYYLDVTQQIKRATREPTLARAMKSILQTLNDPVLSPRNRREVAGALWVPFEELKRTILWEPHAEWVAKTNDDADGPSMANFFGKIQAKIQHNQQQQQQQQRDQKQYCDQTKQQQQTRYRAVLDRFNAGKCSDNWRLPSQPFRVLIDALCGSMDTRKLLVGKVLETAEAERRTRVGDDARLAATWLVTNVGHMFVECSHNNADPHAVLKTLIQRAINIARVCRGFATDPSCLTVDQLFEEEKTETFNP